MAVRNFVPVAITILILSLVKSRVLQNFEGFIVNGVFAKIKDNPHVALLYVEYIVREKNNISFVCGSSILNQAILLTAGHCVEYLPLSEIIITAHVGSRKIKEGLAFLASGHKIHDKYSSVRLDNDVALVKLKNKLEFGRHVRRVALATYTPFGALAEVSGWGTLNEENEIESQYLMKTKQRVWTRAKCMKVLDPTPAGTICGGEKNETSFITKGDSGGALMVQKYIQIGIASYSSPIKCESLAVYTEVAYFYEWIRKNSKHLYCNET